MFEKLTKEQFQEGQVLLIDKPLTWSSFQAVNKIKHTLIKNLDLPKRFKIGHAGTLDPLATGLLIICTGKFTKKIPQFQGLVKEYTGTITLGATTPSYDLETAVDKHFATEHITESLIHKVSQQFVGDIAQYPPIYSAIKKDGKRLYEHARKGEEVEIKSRQINIETFEITRINLPEVDFRVVCSKGTYIRSLAYDFGKALQSGAHLTALRRAKIGGFSVDNAVEPLDFVEMYLNNSPKN